MTLSPAQDVDVLWVVTGDSKLIASLSGVDLVEGEELPVSFDYLEGAGVSVSPALFSMDSTRVEVDLNVLADATPGRLRADNAMPGRLAEVAPQRVKILPREVFLGWDGARGALPGRSTGTLVRVLAGGTVEVKVVLLNPEVLLPGEAVHVDGFDSLGLSFASLTLSPDAVTAMVRIDAAHDVVSNSAVMPDAGLRIGAATVAGADVRVRPLVMAVEPRRFRVVLGEASTSDTTALTWTSHPGHSIRNMTQVNDLIRVPVDLPFETLAISVTIEHTRVGDLQIWMSPPGGWAALLSRTKFRGGRGLCGSHGDLHSASAFCG